MAAQAVRDLKSAHDELTNYLREADFASDYATLLLAAPSPSLRSDATKWAAAAARASLWRPAVRGVSTQIEKELAAHHERARRWLEQVHVCLATVHLSMGGQCRTSRSTLTPCARRDLLQYELRRV